MALNIGRGIKLQGGLSIGKQQILSTKYYTIQNIVWRVINNMQSMEGFISPYDICYFFYSKEADKWKWFIYRDDNFALVYQRKDDTFEGFDDDEDKVLIYTYNPNNVSYKGWPKCLIDLKCDTFYDGTREITAYPRVQWHNPHTYYQNILAQALQSI